MSRPQNWLQLVQGAAVGGSGQVVNLCVFAACLRMVGLDHRISAVIGFLVAVRNTFWLNGHWTFGAREGHLGAQAVGFFAVSLMTFGFTYPVLMC